MSKGVTSKHLGGANELLLLVPIKMGLAAGMPYATRLRTLLETLYALRKSEAEDRGEDGSGPLDRLQSIYTTKWAVLDDDPAAPRLLVSACFDRSWEDYARILVDKTGPLLDLLFIHCEGYQEAHTCVLHGHEAFSAFLRSHQIPVSLFHTGLPNVTVDDVRYYRKLATRPASVAPASVIIGTPKEEEQEQLTKLPLKKQQEEAAKRELRNTGMREKLDQLGALFPDVPGVFKLAADSLVQETPIAQLPPTTKVVTPKHIQGNILRPYLRIDYGRAVLLSCKNPGGLTTLLAALREKPLITTEENVTERLATERGMSGQLCLNVALTFAGLARSGLSEEQLGWFPREFAEGMSERAALVGDVGVPNHPKYWDEQVNLADVDAVVILQGDYDTLKEAEAAFKSAYEAIGAAGADILHIQPLQRQFEDKEQLLYREHFRFLDSGAPRTGSQPVPNVKIGDAGPDLSAAENVSKTDVVPLGEILLGYADSTGRIAPCADPDKNEGSFKLFKDSTFLVMRKLEQHVDAFDQFVERNGKGKLDADVRARMLGRTEHGKPMAALNSAEPNDFDYKKDAHGLECPLHAHIRRANPRKPGTPRILRRSFSYGGRYVKPADQPAQNPQDAPTTKSANSERGLLFMAYNASIAAQFEVIQRWLNGGNSTGLSSVQNDLLTAPHRGGDHAFLMETYGKGGCHAFRLEDGREVEPVVLDQTDVKRPFVSLKWGLYLFVPSLTAIDELIGRPVEQPRVVREPATTPEAKLDRLLAELGLPMEGPKAHLPWKQVLEADDKKTAAADVWRAIRATTKRTLKTPYGLLVATAEDAKEVLSDEAKFSVREYWQRLRETIGEHYLAMDHAPTAMGKRKGESELDDALYELRVPEGLYERLSSVPNGYIWDRLSVNAYAFPGNGTPTAPRPFDLARQLTHASIGEFVRLPSTDPARVRLLIKDLVAMSIGRLAEQWIGLPLSKPSSGFEVAQLMDSFVQVSFCSFQPYPDAELRQKARLAGRSLVAAYSAAPKRLETELAGELRKGYPESGKASEELIQLALIGAIVGFAPPAIAATITALLRLLGSLGSEKGLKLAEGPTKGIIEAVLDALVGAPVPPVLYRTAMPGAQLRGEPIEAGSFVIVGTHSAWQSAREKNESDAWKWMFGGDHQRNTDGTSKTAHGCPARFAAVDAMAGIIAEILQLDDLKQEGAALSFNKR